MSDGKKRRKFKCPNCDHMVKFQVDPEKTLIACDHCGQLTRVTMKSSEAVGGENSKARSGSQDRGPANSADQLVSQAFEDLDLDGLDDRDSVASATLGKQPAKKQPTRKPKKQKPSSGTSPKPSSENSQSSRTDRKNANAPNRNSVGDDTTNPEASLQESQPAQPTHPPLTNSTPQASVTPPVPPTFPSETLSGFDHRPSHQPIETNEPIRYVISESSDRKQTGLPEADYGNTPDNNFSRPNPFGLFRPDVQRYDQDNLDDEDIEFADPISEEDSNSKAQDELLILNDEDGLEQIDSTLGSDNQQEDIRVICRVCDTLSYFAPADYYICQDCYSKIDANGLPIKSDAGTRSQVTEDGRKDEIDDLISTAIDERPTQESLWTSQTQAIDSDLIEDTDGLLEADDVQSHDADLPELLDDEEDDELRLAPLDDPTEEYRQSILPHGHQLDVGESNPNRSTDAKAPDRVSEFTDQSDHDELEELPKLVSSPETETETTQSPKTQSPETEPTKNSDPKDSDEEKFEWRNQPEITAETSDVDVPQIDSNQSLTTTDQSDNLDELSLEPLDNNTESKSSDGNLGQHLEEHSASGNSSNSHSETASNTTDYDPLLDPANVPRTAPAILPPTDVPQNIATGAQPPLPPPFVEQRIERSGDGQSSQASDSTVGTPPDSQTTNYHANAWSTQSSTPTSSRNQTYTLSNSSAPKTSYVNAPSGSFSHAPTGTNDQSGSHFGDSESGSPKDHLIDRQSSPLEFGWFGDLTILFSGWVIAGIIVLAICVSLFLTTSYFLLSGEMHWFGRTIAAFGVILFIIPTAILWVWLFGIIVDQKHDKRIGELFDAARMTTHGIRLSIWFLLCIPGLILGALTGFPVFGILVALFYSSPVALYLCVISQLSNRPLVFFDAHLIEVAKRHQDLLLTGIGVLGLSILVSVPIFVLASYVPLPGLFLAGPVMVGLSITLALQVVRITETIRLLQEMETGTL